MIKSIKVKLLATDDQKTALIALITTMNLAANATAQMAFRANAFTQVPLHHLCYYWLREQFGLPANHAVDVISKVVASFARDKTVCPEFRLNGSIPLHRRLYRLLRDGFVSVSTLDGRIKVPYQVADKYIHLLTGKLGEAKLLREGNAFYLIIAVTVPEPDIQPAQDVIGVDLGISNLASTSDGKFFTGDRIKIARRRHARARQTYQRRGTKNSKRRLKKLSRKQSRFQKHTNHCISKTLVEQAKTLNCGIALENLSGIRDRVEKTASRSARKAIGNWAFDHLKFCIQYKARLAGVPVVMIDPRYTSQSCAECGYCSRDNRKNQADFLCKKCGYQTHADHNGALNIRALGALTLCPHLTATLMSSINTEPAVCSSNLKTELTN